MGIATALAGLALLAPEAGPATALVNRAETAYFAGEFANAWVDLEAALAKDPEFSTERPRIHLLRAAVKLKLGDPVAAGDEAYRALLADPELELEDYPSDVARVFAAAKERLPARVVVQLTGLPAGADARLDGRPMKNGVVSVVPGLHRLTVAKTGYIPHEQRLEITKSDAIPILLTPDPAAGSKWQRRVTGSLLGLSAASAAGGGWALNGLSATRGNKAKAGPGQSVFYEKHERRFTQSAVAGFTIAAVAGSIGGYRLFRDARSGPVAVTLVPATDGAGVVLSGRF